MSVIIIIIIIIGCEFFRMILKLNLNRDFKKSIENRQCEIVTTLKLIAFSVS
jgi:hypothetical protein